MTGAEVWSVAKSSASKLISLAAERHVEVEITGGSLLASYSQTPVMTLSQKAVMRNTMTSNALIGGGLYKAQDPAAVELELSRNQDSVGSNAPPASVTLPLNAELTVSATRQSLERTRDGYIWHGVIANSREPVTLVWNPADGLAGNITHNGRLYEIKPMGGRMTGVVEFAPDKLPPQHERVDQSASKVMDIDPLAHLKDVSSQLGDQKTKDKQLEFRTSSPRRAQNGKAITTISLIVAYTARAASFYTNIQHDLIAVAVAETNQSFRESGIYDVQLKLVHSYQTNYLEHGSHFDHLFRFVYDHDGYMDEVHELRKRYKANIAILIVDDPKGCGLSAGVSATADRAFSVVDHQCAALTFSMAHEVGHLLGARHELALDDSITPFRFGHGFVSASHQWRDIMSYPESCNDCPRLPIWSNPRVFINGESAGNDMSDNAEVIEERAQIVSKF